MRDIIEYKPNMTERILNVIAPKKAGELYKNRVSKNLTIKMGYDAHGASRRKNALIGWLTNPGSAEKDIDNNVGILRERARDLDAGGGVSRAATRTLRTNVIGQGIQAKPKVNYKTLNISEDAAYELEQKITSEFNLWASTTMCDARRTKNFYALQQLAYLSMLISGDVIVLLPNTERKGDIYSTKIRIIEADRLMTPGRNGRDGVSELGNGNRIINGVEYGKNGEVIAYHIANRHPYSGFGDEKTTRIAAYDDMGIPNVLHIMEMERPEQTRGVPYVSPEIENIKQLDRYINSELASNLVSSMLTVFLEQEQSTGTFGMEDAINDEEKISDDESKIELAPGAIYKLPAGMKPNVVNPMRTNSAYADYVDSLFTSIGASLEIPKEVMLKKFASNYTASRGALLEFWKVAMLNRRNFIYQFCQPIYETWFSEAVALGRIEAPGYFRDLATRRAYTNCEWIGGSMGVIDPLKEVKAAAQKIEYNLSTVEREAAELNGSNWSDNIQQRAKELNLRNSILEEEDATKV